MKESVTIQVRIDPELKDNAQNLYESMGISISEAIRIFLSQSVKEQRIPFTPSGRKRKIEMKAAGILSFYAKSSAREGEREAWVTSLANSESIKYERSRVIKSSGEIKDI